MANTKFKNAPVKVQRLYKECVRVSKQGRDYVYGGDHGRKLNQVGPHDGLDCSSSTSYVLWRVGLYSLPTAITSGLFKNWGAAGKGKYFTVWYNDDHVWIQFHGLGRYWRFDTSPHALRGFGAHGPRVRRSPRFTAGFKPRHYPGL